MKHIITTIILCWLVASYANCQCLGYLKKGTTTEGRTIYAVGRMVTMAQPGDGLTITPVVDNTGLTYFGISWHLPDATVLAHPILHLLLAQGHNITLQSLTRYERDSHLFALSATDKAMLAEYPVIKVMLVDTATDVNHVSAPLHPDFFICSFRAVQNHFTK